MFKTFLKQKYLKTEYVTCHKFHLDVGGEIPDATTIHQIRKQRQMARDMGDFMPLDDTVKFENSKSRLVRYVNTDEF